MVIRYILHRLRMNMRKPREGIVVAQAGHSLNCKEEKFVFKPNIYSNLCQKYELHSPRIEYRVIIKDCRL